MDQERLYQLFLKYHRKGGRYTIYPLLQQWDNQLESENWLKSLSIKKEQSIDLYIHIPFCPSLCSFCGCNIKISRDYHEQENYVQALIKEWSLYRQGLGDCKIANIYLGGGTPTSLPAPLLQRLLESILTKENITDHFQGTFETDPRLPHKDVLSVLKSFNFKRMSMGIQDFDHKVLLNINREQSFDQIQETTKLARSYGVNEVFYDFIYGLPLQTAENFSENMKNLRELSPSGVTLYPLAHVPWQKGVQNAFGEFKPLGDEEKYKVFTLAQENLQKQDFCHVGMGHFFQKSSPTGLAFQQGSLRRHIMGFTPQRSHNLIGLGVSAISYANGHLAQNERVLDRYMYKLQETKLPFERGHRQSHTEEKLHRLFEQLICHGSIDLAKNDVSPNQESLIELKEDGLITLNEEKLQVTSLGRFFFKNIDLALDPLAN